jgi:hypothetical protein
VKLAYRHGAFFMSRMSRLIERRRRWFRDWQNATVVWRHHGLSELETV